MADSIPMIATSQLADVIRKGARKVMIIDSRSFLEFNTCHITESVNVCCSKLVKRRLQHGKVQVCELLAQAGHVPVGAGCQIIVYDQCTEYPDALAHDCFLIVLLHKLIAVFHSVTLLSGGFVQFQASHPSLCDAQAGSTTTCKLSMSAMSQPCMPVTNVGPTRILPFLYLGSQQDALDGDTAAQYGITYVLNVSKSCPRPAHIQETHFLRIPVNDNYCDNLSYFFPEAFCFLDKVREANGVALVHCLAGISRSPTLAIAYVMKHLNMSTDEAYKYVKEKRPTISPNFNFLGQLLEHDRCLQRQRAAAAAAAAAAAVTAAAAAAAAAPTAPLSAPPCVPPPAFPSTAPQTPPACAQKKQRTLRPCLRRLLRSWHAGTPFVQSPTSALAQLNFNQPSPVLEETPPAPAPAAPGRPPRLPPRSLGFPLYPTTSLDQLAFTACLASDDCVTAKSGVKRSISDSQERSATVTASTAAKTQEGGAAATSPGAVILRSPGAKRPLVRPNSIAFSSYPLFDTADAAAVDSPPLPTPPARLANLHDDEPPKRNSLEAGRKSRSLEDILAADTPAPVDILSPDCLRCRASTDPHQSSSSISSNGSIHGSLELIEVS